MSRADGLLYATASRRDAGTEISLRNEIRKHQTYSKLLGCWGLV